MSLLNSFTGQQAGRPAARPIAAQDGQQQSWGQQPQQPVQGGQQQWAQQAPQPAYGQQPHPQNYGQPQQDYRAPQSAGYPAGPQADPYAAQFESINAAPRAAQPGYQPQQQYGANSGQGLNQGQGQAWSPQQADPRGFDVGSYMTPAQAAAAQASAAYRTAHAEPEFSQSEWHHHQPGHHQQGQDMGFAQPAGGDLDPNYGEEEHDYEADDAPRGRRPMMLAAALTAAILVGGGMAYGYKSIFGHSGNGEPPTIKSATAPSKIKPADAGGKQFSHADSKIMGRLGDGSSEGGATASAAGEVDASGTRKVATLVVGRDGSIQAPAAAEASAASMTDSARVPGMTVVDALGGSKAPSAAAAVAPQAAQAAAQKLMVAPPVAEPKPVVIAKAAVAPAIPAATGSIDQPAVAAPVAAKKVVPKKIVAAAPATADAAAAPVAASVATTGGASGFVAVLASVPRSNSSRLDALKRFADMQQKYGAVLASKTPDVAEANLGAKGAYHRLVVGPPGSREQASALCSQLKAQGYADCWVTSY